VSVATVPGPSPQSIASICGEFPDAAMDIQAEDHQASCIECPHHPATRLTRSTNWDQLALELFQLKVLGCSPPESVAALPFSLTGDGDRVAGASNQSLWLYLGFGGDRRSSLGHASLRLISESCF
jgi:hypothetical protein